MDYSATLEKLQSAFKDTVEACEDQVAADKDALQARILEYAQAQLPKFGKTQFTLKGNSSLIDEVVAEFVAGGFIMKCKHEKDSDYSYVDIALPNAEALLARINRVNTFLY